MHQCTQSAKLFLSLAGCPKWFGCPSALNIIALLVSINLSFNPFCSASFCASLNAFT
ncbi:hypothetical protein HanRHA438_Chr14g0663101 [Helianthus annuus]|nr:hypothetical protein HanRHA438_Chr14g0663101 [Helianthus annuus]